MIVSVLCLAVGLGLLFLLSTGSTHVSLSGELSRSLVHVDLSLRGRRVLPVIALTGVGVFLLLLAWLGAILTRSSGRGGGEAPARGSRRRGGFVE